MKALNYRGLLPEVGTVAVMGRDIEDPIIRALAYEQAEEKNLYLIPLTPEQMVLAQRLGIETKKGYPDYMYMEVDREAKEGLFVAGGTEYPMLMRLYEMGADRTIVFLRNKYHTVSVEYVSYLREEIEPIISLFGEIVSRKENGLGNTVVDIVSTEEDMEFLRSKLLDVPGVVEAAIIPTIPYKKIVLRR